MANRFVKANITFPVDVLEQRQKARMKLNAGFLWRL